jgi:peptidyl-prolyl cis-trans isomerase A (cyclophilin A)
MYRRIALVVLCCSLAFAQGAKKTKSASAKKSGAQPATHPTAILHTTAGDMSCELFPDKAPKAVANFIGLASGKKDWKNSATGETVHGKPLYDGVIFHRTIPNFMIQGGDPTGTGSGDVGFTFEDELHPDLLFDKPGRLAMANRGPNTNSSQFFITETEVPFLNPCLDPNGCMGGRRPPNSGYTIFGQCDDNTVELVKKIARMPCQGGKQCDQYNSRPADPVKISHIEIRGGGAAPKSGPGKKSGITKGAAKSAKPSVTPK